MAAKVRNEELVAYLFDGQPHNLADRLSRWVDNSRPFKAFTDEYRNKIRKKIRITRHNGSAIEDLAAELEAAYQLVRQKTFSVAYEPYGSQKTRGPDFSVTYKSLAFNVEVTRIDSSGMALSGTPPALNPEQVRGRLMDTVCDKLGQMLPGAANVLYVVIARDFFAALDVELAMAELKELVEQKEAGLYGRHRFEKPADFFKYYLNLSGILIQTHNFPARKNSSSLWLNNQAKHPLSGPIQSALKKTA